MILDYMGIECDRCYRRARLVRWTFALSWVLSSLYH